MLRRWNVYKNICGYATIWNYERGKKIGPWLRQTLHIHGHLLCNVMHDAHHNVACPWSSVMQCNVWCSAQKQGTHNIQSMTLNILSYCFAATWFFDGVHVVHPLRFFSCPIMCLYILSYVLLCPIMCLYILSSVLWCPFRFPHNNDVRFVFISSCL